ncbi:MAG: hypothetical protein WCG52_11540 [bacterium]
MSDYVRELDAILNSASRKLLENAGAISSTQAQEKAKQELQRYNASTLDQVEKDYLKTISSLEKKAKKESQKKEGKASKRDHEFTRMGFYGEIARWRRGRVEAAWRHHAICR